MLSKTLKILIIILFLFPSLNSCDVFRYTSSKDTPVRGIDRATKNVQEGRGVNLRGLGGSGRGTTYEFSTSNPLWRASLETLDFLPMATVDYSGGMIITDWYTDNNSNDESIKISVRFLSNEIASSSLKIIVHKKKCINNSCSTEILSNSKISEELRSTILKSAIRIDKNDRADKAKKKN